MKPWNGRLQEYLSIALIDEDEKKNTTKKVWPMEFLGIDVDQIISVFLSFGFSFSIADGSFV